VRYRKGEQLANVPHETRKLCLEELEL